MSKAVSVPMQTHLAQETTTLCRCWHLTRTDGVEFFFTDAAKDVLFEGNTYAASTGFESSAVANDSGLASSAVTINGFFSTAITVEDIRAGLFDSAEVRLAIVNWADPTMGSIRVRRGWLGEVVSDPQGAFNVELRSMSQIVQQSMGELYSPECRAQLGDNRCKVNLGPFTVTTPISAVASRGGFTVQLVAPPVDNWFNGGLCTFVTGENAGRRMEVRAWSQASQTVTLFLPIGYLPTVGDVVTMVAGCDKMVATCLAKFNNVVNFRGEPALPGNDKILLYPGTPTS